jgi:hypothetical protein
MLDRPYRPSIKGPVLCPSSDDLTRVRRQSGEEEAERSSTSSRREGEAPWKGEEPGAIWPSRRLPMTDAQEEVPFSFPSARFNELNIGQPIGEDDG